MGGTNNTSYDFPTAWNSPMVSSDIHANGSRVLVFSGLSFRSFMLCVLFTALTSIIRCKMHVAFTKSFPLIISGCFPKQGEGPDKVMISGERQMVWQKAARWPCGVCNKGVGSNSLQCTKVMMPEMGT